jgi:Protein of unknown function (DUF2971)
LRATSIHYLNDINEFRSGLEVAATYLRSLGDQADDTGDRSLAEMYWQLAADIKVAVEADVFVASFSTLGDSLPQWRAYCRGGGYAVAFDGKRLAAIAKRHYFDLLRCLYGKGKLEAIIKERTDQWTSWIRRPHPPSLSGFNVVRTVLRTGLKGISAGLKDRSFEEESEWRLVRSVDPEFASVIPTNIEYRDKGQIIVPYVTLPIDDPDPPLPITGLVVGPHAHPELALRGARSLVKSCGLDPNIVTRTDAPYREL